MKRFDESNVKNKSGDHVESRLRAHRQYQEGYMAQILLEHIQSEERDYKETKTIKSKNATIA